MFGVPMGGPNIRNARQQVMGQMMGGMQSAQTPMGVPVPKPIQPIRPLMKPMSVENPRQQVMKNKGIWG